MNLFFIAIALYVLLVMLVGACGVWTRDKDKDCGVVLVALNANPKVPPGASRAEAITIISAELHRVYRQFSSWIRSEERLTQLSVLEDRTINPIVKVNSTPRVVQMLLSGNYPKEACVDTAELDRGWATSL